MGQMVRALCLGKGCFMANAANKNQIMAWYGTAWANKRVISAEQTWRDRFRTVRPVEFLRKREWP